MAVLRYGDNLSVQLESAEGTSTDELGEPRGEPLANLVAAVTAALDAPLNYPTLMQCMTPGDRVVIALDRGVPQIAQVTAAVVDVLIQAGVEPDGITVLQSQADHDAGVGDPRRLITSPLSERVAWLVHDPDDRKGLAYLAADKAGEAILINRALHEADVVLPVGCLRGEKSAGYFGIHGAIYPTFSDTKTLQRFRGFASLNGRGARRRELTADVEHVAWLLGVTFIVQIVPAAGEQVLHVLAGESEAVRRRGDALHHAAWDWPVTRQADLVVASIEGGPGQQTWENLGRSLHVAGSFVEDDGAIAVCCGLSASLGPAMRRLSCESSREAALRHVGKERPADAIAAAQLAHALDRNRVYLLSRLDDSVVEELDMIPIDGPEELARLVRRHPSCILLANAPNVTVVEEGEE
jgi:nickel-dependent lactate racemase